MPQKWLKNVEMIVLIKILQVILALSILILVHELGHFIFAKAFRIRVDKFFLFFEFSICDKNVVQKIETMFTSKT